MTEMFAQIVQRGRLIKDQLAVAAVGAGVMAGHRFTDKREAAAQLSCIVITVAADIAAGQHRSFSPCRANAFVVRRQFLQRVFGQLTVGGELTAEDR